MGRLRTKRLGSLANDSRLAVIYHPDKVDLPKLQAAVERTLLESHEHWLPTLWYPTTANQAGGEQASDSLTQRATQLMVVGGDGTLRAVFEGVIHKQTVRGVPVPIGLVPAGTGNILARNLGLPLMQLQASVRRAILGGISILDGAQAHIRQSNGKELTHVFTMMSGVGLDASIILNADPKLKSRIGWLAYFDAGLKSLPLKYEKVAISVDGRPAVTKKVLTLLVGNVGLLPMKMAVMPAAKLDDGLLDVAVIAPRRFWHWAHLWSRITFESWILGNSQAGRWVLENTKDIKTLENLSGRVIEVVPEQPLHVQIDGDSFGEVTYLKFEVLPATLHLKY